MNHYLITCWTEIGRYRFFASVVDGIGALRDCISAEEESTGYQIFSYRLKPVDKREIELAKLGV